MLTWVTVRGCTVLVCNQLLRLTLPVVLSRMGNEYRPRGGGSALWSEGDRRIDLASHRPRVIHVSSYGLSGFREWDEYPAYTL